LRDPHRKVTAGTKHHRSGAPESAGEILRGEAGFPGLYGPRWTDSNGACVSIANEKVKEGTDV